MIAKCSCVKCGGGIEFSLDEFEFRHETASERVGQLIKCPHCGQNTILSIPKEKPPTDDQRAVIRQRLVPCADCSTNISRDAFMCPACGRIAGVRFRLVWDVMCNFWLVGLIWAIIAFAIGALLVGLGEVAGWWAKLFHLSS